MPKSCNLRHSTGTDPIWFAQLVTFTHLYSFRRKRSLQYVTLGARQFLHLCMHVGKFLWRQRFAPHQQGNRMESKPWNKTYCSKRLTQRVIFVASKLTDLRPHTTYRKTLKTSPGSQYSSMTGRFLDPPCLRMLVSGITDFAFEILQPLLYWKWRPKWCQEQLCIALCLDIFIAWQQITC